MAVVWPKMRPFRGGGNWFLTSLPHRRSTQNFKKCCFLTAFHCLPFFNPFWSLIGRWASQRTARRSFTGGPVLKGKKKSLLRPCPFSFKTVFMQIAFPCSKIFSLGIFSCNSGMEVVGRPPTAPHPGGGSLAPPTYPLTLENLPPRRSRCQMCVSNESMATMIVTKRRVTVWLFGKTQAKIKPIFCPTITFPLTPNP